MELLFPADAARTAKATSQARRDFDYHAAKDEQMAQEATALAGSNAGCSVFTQTIKAETASSFTTDGEYDTSTGIGVTISAPGEDQENVTSSCFASSVGILSTRLGGGTTRLSGTGMSAPHVSGVAALLGEKALSTGGTLDPETARGLIRSRASGVSVAPLDSPTFHAKLRTAPTASVNHHSATQSSECLHDGWHRSGCRPHGGGIPETLVTLSPLFG